MARSQRQIARFSIIAQARRSTQNDERITAVRLAQSLASKALASEASAVLSDDRSDFPTRGDQCVQNARSRYRKKRPVAERRIVGERKDELEPSARPPRTLAVADGCSAIEGQVIPASHW